MMSMDDRDSFGILDASIFGGILQHNLNFSQLLYESYHSNECQPWPTCTVSNTATYRQPH